MTQTQVRRSAFSLRRYIMARMNWKAAFGLAVLLGVFCVLACVPVLEAQVVNGNIVGSIHDPSGAGVPGAKVTAKNTATGLTRATTSGSTGNYQVLSVPAGPYEIRVEAPGFRTLVRSGIQVTVGASVTVGITLQVGALQQQVVVTGAPPQIQTTTSTMSGLVGGAVVRQLPLNGRDWLQLASLQPGVLDATTQSADAGTDESRGLGPKMSISGGRPSENVYRIDGLVVNDYTNNAPGSALGVNLGVEAIAEFSVLTNTYPAEYGGSSGGVINAITKSGTNSIHGSAYEFLRNSNLDARNFFDIQKPPFRRNQFGASIGGPIKKDKLFYFANYEGLRQFLSESFVTNTLSPAARQGNLTEGTVTVDPRVAPYLPLFPLPNGPVTGDTGQFIFAGGEAGAEDYGIGKIDYQISAKTTLSGSYNIDNANVNVPDIYNEKDDADSTRDEYMVVTLQHIFSATVLNTARVGFSRSLGNADLDNSPKTSLLTDPSLGFVPGANVGVFYVPGLGNSSVGTFGGIGSTGADVFAFTAPQAADDLSWVKGRHTIQVGASVLHIRDNTNAEDNPAGFWQFGSIADMLQAIPQEFDADFPGTNSDRGMRTTIFGAYVQDDFRFRPNLTLNLGVRYEPSTVITEAHNKIANLHSLSAASPVLGAPFYQNPTLLNFAPRVGFAWEPFGGGKTVIRSAFGVFDVDPMPNLFHNRITRTVPFYKAGILSDPPSSSFPNGAFALLGPTSLRTIYVQFSPPAAYKLQWNLNVERQLTQNLSLMVGYVGSRGVHLPLATEDTNQVPPDLVTTTADGRLQFPTTGPIQKINPNFHKISATEWDGYSTYHALQANVVERLSHGFFIQGAYQWSKCIDNGSEEFGSSESLNSSESPWAFDPALNRGLCDYNVPQHLSINALWMLPSLQSHMAVAHRLLSGWQLGGIYTVQSGPPFSVRIPVDQARTGTSTAGIFNGGERPNYVLGPGCPANGNATNPGNPNDYINLQCFSFPALGVLGNVGRNTLEGPGLEDFDFSLFKNDNLFSEKLNVQFRVEMFNLFNRANFQSQVTSVFDKSGAIIPTAGILPAPTVTTSRQIQFGLKLTW